VHLQVTVLICVRTFRVALYNLLCYANVLNYQSISNMLSLDKISHLALCSLLNNLDDNFVCNSEYDIRSVDRLAAVCAICVISTLYLEFELHC
jgi:hypothetical protein